MMNKRIISIFIAVLLCLSLSVFVSAQENDRTLGLVEDYADLLTDEEERMLSLVRQNFKSVIVLLNVGGIIDIPSVIIVVGGSYMALFVSSPINMVVGIWGVIKRDFKTYDYGEKNSVQNMVQLSEKARREGILALEEGLEDLDDAFLKEGLRLMVDGNDASAIRGILENEMAQTEARHMQWAGILNQWAGYAPGWGMLGTVIGLIGMLNNLEDKSSLGPNMAVALITTLLTVQLQLHQTIKKALILQLQKSENVK